MIRRLLASVSKQKKGQSLRVLTSHAVATVIGTHFEVLAKSEATVVEVNEGIVLVQHRHSGRSYRLVAGEEVVATKSAIGLPDGGSAGSAMQDDGLFGGLNAYHVIGPYRRSQELARREAVAASVVDVIEVPTALQECVGGAVLEGFLIVPSDGIYEFEGMADDSMDLEIDGELVLRSSKAKRWVSGRMELSAGPRLLRIGYLNTQSAGSLNLRWGLVGADSQPIAAESLRRRSARALRGSDADRWVATVPAYGNNDVSGLGDEDLKTVYWSNGGCSEGDVVGVYFGEPREISRIVADTGSEEAPEDILADGGLEVSTDGVRFVRIAEFKEGRAQGEWSGGPLRAVRIVVDAASEKWLVVRELSFE